MSQDLQKGGGVAFLVKSETSFEKMQMPVTTSFGKTTIKTEKDNKTSFFTVIYRPPSKSFEKFFAEFEEFRQYISKLKVHCICGDFNIDILSKFNTVFKYELLIKKSSTISCLMEYQPALPKLEKVFWIISL